MKSYNVIGLWMISAAAANHGFQLPQSSLRGSHWNRDNLEVQRNRDLSNVKKYTTDADFALGSLIHVNYDDISDQLQMDSNWEHFDVVWVAATARGTVVKINANTGKVLGEYRTTPSSHGSGSPTRTSVDFDGSVWITNSNNVYDGYGSIVHVALLENNQCEDRNGNGIIDTSTGLGYFMAWTDSTGIHGVDTADDECIVHYTKVNSKGTRHVSVTSTNDVWVSGSTLRNFDLIKGGKYDVDDSGTIVRKENSVNFGGYGGLIDFDGVIWSAGPDNLLRWDSALNLTGANGDPTGNDVGPPNLGSNWSGQSSDSNGMCIDGSGNIWITQVNGDKIRKYASDGKFLGDYSHGFTSAQGCAVGPGDDVYVAHSVNGDTVGHLKNDGTFVGNIVLEGTDGLGPGSGPTGVSVDRNGMIWVTNYKSNTVSRIDTTLGDLGEDETTPLGKVDLTIDLGDGASPDNYSDMTGWVLVEPPLSGTWTVTYAGSDWQSLEWNADVPNGTSLIVRARSSTDNTFWTQWETAETGKPLNLSPRDFLQTQVIFNRPPDSTDSPLLYELAVVSKQTSNSPPVAADDSVSTSKNTAITIKILDNDSDPDGDVLAIKSCTTPSNGAAVVNGADVTYTPNQDFTGENEFTCTVCDPLALCDDETITVTVRNNDPLGNDPPVAVDDAVSTYQNTAITIKILDNDTDPDGDALTIKSCTEPTNGISNLSETGIMYTPNDDYIGDDEFVCTVCDPLDLCDDGTITVTVQERKSCSLSGGFFAYIWCLFVAKWNWFFGLFS